MTRLIRIVTYVVCIVAAAVMLVERQRPVAPESAAPIERAVGVAEMERRLAALRDDMRAAPDTIVVMGDSSLLEHQLLRSDQTLASMLERDAPAAGLRIRVLANRGFDAVTYYLLARPIATLRPRAVVLIANLQAFTDKWFRNLNIKHPDLVAFLGPAHWVEAIGLPLEDAGIANADVLTMPILHALRMAEVPRALRDVRDRFRARMVVGFTAEAQAETATAPRRRVPGGMRGLRRRPPTPGAWTSNPFRNTDLYPHRLQRDAAAVRVMAAAVRSFTDRGVPTIAVIPPLHLQALTVAGAYEARDIPGAIAVVRDVVTENGGVVIDVTRALPEERYFTDAHTHFTEEGNRIVAGETLRRLPEVLGATPP